MFAKRLGKTQLTAVTYRTTLSGKGQIVIPKGVRDAHDWQPGTGFEVIDRPDGVLLRPLGQAAPRLSLAAFRLAVGPHEGAVVTLAEMDAAALSALVRLEGVTVDRVAGVTWALARHAAGADLADMLHIVAASGTDGFATFDRGVKSGAGAAPPIAIEVLTG